ncbi:MAG: ArsR family transcriptional regulator [Candidatus Micrarchaeia archaeon]
MDPLERLLFWLLDGTRGGPTRIALLSILSKRPMNLRQLSIAAGIDYKTAEHHVQLLIKNSVLGCIGSGYGKAYFVTDEAKGQRRFIELAKGGNNGGKKKD